MGYQIVYADRDLLIPEQFIWPDWCQDLPKSGNICHTGQPICSIIAHQNEFQSVEEQLLARQQLIINQLQRF
jgi:methenyltetrahydromethanopterin cyclohydrolase